MKTAYICFTASIIGILSLFLISLSPPKQISSQSEMKLGDYVQVQGKIIYSKSFGDTSLAILGNNITLFCECPLKTGQEVIAEGLVQEYNKKIEIKIEKIKSS